MADRRAGGTQRRQSWRESRSNAKSGSRGLPRRVKASLWTAAAVLLLIALGWWLYTPKVARTHVYVLAAGDTANLSTPMIPWHAAPLDSIELPSLRNLDFSSRVVESSSRSHLKDLASLKLAKRDRLVVYVSGHVVPSADHESAQLMCRDYDLDHPTAANVVPIRTILNMMIETDAGIKLLVVDSGRLNSDPRLGMLANDATDLLAKELRDLAASDVWVLTSNDSLEPGTGWYGTRRTTFGESFVLGLTGQADSAPVDAYITLGELYQFVKERCWQITRGIQRPQLLHAAADFDPDNVDTRLLTLAFDPGEPQPGEPVDEAAPDTAKSADDIPADPAPSENETNVGGNENENENASDTSEEPDTSEKTDDAVATTADADATATPEEDNSKQQPAGAAMADLDANRPDAPSVLLSDNPRIGLLNEGWNLRDNLQQTIERGVWSPCDYAPHLWRELNSQMLDHEFRLVGDNSDGSAGAVKELEKIVAGLRRLQEYVRNPDSATRISATGTPGSGQTGDWLPSKLLDAAARARTADERLTFESNSQRMSNLSLNHRKIQRGTFFMPPQAGWFAEASLVASDTDKSLDEWADQLLRAISLCRQYFQKMASTSRLTELEIPEVEQLQNDALNSIKTLQDNWDKYVSALSHSAEIPRQRWLIEVTLGSPLLNAESRAQLRAELQASEVTALENEKIDTDQAALHKWKRFEKLCKIEAELLSQATIPFAANADNLQYAANKSTKLHDIGQRLAAEYASLSKNYRLAASHRILNLVDARDARQIENSEVVHPRFDLQGPPELVVVKSPLGILDLDLPGHELTWEIECTNPEQSDSTAYLDFDERRVQITTPSGDTVTSGQKLNYRFTNGRQTLTFRIRPVESTFLPLAESELQFNLRSGDADPVLSKLTLRRPPPNVVDVVATLRASPKVKEQRSLGRNGILLQPFANRSSTFDLALKNLSGKSRQVNVRIATVPPIPRLANGRLLDSTFEPLPSVKLAVLDSSGKLRSQLKTVAATTQPVDLPPTRDIIPISLAKPVPPNAKPDTDAPPPTPDPPKLPDISFGLVCEITDVAQPENRWLKWLEIAPLAPAEFLRCERGESAPNEFAIDIYSDQPGATMPDLASFQKQPMVVEWNSTSLPPSLTRKNLVGQIQAPGEKARVLVAHDGKQNSPFRLHLDIDGYPRAFSYGTSFSPASNLEPIEQVMVRVNMRTQSHDRRFPFSGAKRPPSQIVLPVPSQDDKDIAEIELQIDPPVNTFGRDNPEDHINVSWENAASIVSGFSQRNVSAELASLEDGLAIKTNVSDFHQQLDLRGKSGKLFLAVQSKVQGTDQVLARIPVVIDAEVPTLKASVDSVVYLNRNVSCELVASDNTVLSTGVAGIVETETDPIAKKYLVDVKNQRRIQRTISLPTQGLSTGDYYVKVEVADQVGNLNSAYAKFSIQPPKPKKVVPLKFAFRGRVRVGKSTYPDRITVELVGSGAKPQRTEDGWFQFAGIDPGEYTIKASGNVRNYPYAKEHPIKLLKKGDPTPQPVIVQLEKVK